MVEKPPPMPSRPTTPPPHLTLNTSLRGTPAAIPNKHIPVCSPGRAPAVGLSPPPPRPPPSILYPVDRFTKALETPTLYTIDPSTVAEAIEHHATQPLPDPKLVF